MPRAREYKMPREQDPEEFLRDYIQILIEAGQHEMATKIKNEVLSTYYDVSIVRNETNQVMNDEIEKDDIVEVGSKPLITIDINLSEKEIPQKSEVYASCLKDKNQKKKKKKRKKPRSNSEKEASGSIIIKNELSSKLLNKRGKLKNLKARINPAKSSLNKKAISVKPISKRYIFDANGHEKFFKIVYTILLCKINIKLSSYLHIRSDKCKQLYYALFKRFLKCNLRSRYKDDRGQYLNRMQRQMY